MAQIETSDIDLLFKMAKVVNSKTSEAVQEYLSNEKLIGFIVQYRSRNLIKAIWFDTEKLSERDLKYLLKHHKQSNKQFFINYIDGFYRIGFKI